MVAMWTCFDGTRHPVSKEFADRVPAELNGLSAGEVRSRHTALMTAIPADLLDGDRPELSSEERALLDALTHVLNLNRALIWLKGRDYREIFGAKATLDQVHGNSITKECGCVLQFAFDHNKRTQAGIKMHPHHSLKACDKHAHLKDDFVAHHKAVEAKS